jgi:hypothetical protein
MPAPLDPDAPFRPKPVHFKLLDAYESAYQEGKSPTDTVIGAKMGVRRETICRWRRRSPKMVAWIYECIGKIAEQRKAFVDRRVTHLAESGSVDHAKLFYQFVAKVGVPLGDGGPNDGKIIVQNNFLIPRPDYSQPAIPAQASAPVVSSIPTVSVTR